MKNNKIPRKFNLIVGKMLIDTNVNKANDIVHISKNDYGDYSMFNTRTKGKAHMFISMLRNSEIFELISID